MVSKFGLAIFLINSMKPFCTFFLTLILAGFAVGQGLDISSLSKTQGGARVIAYFAAFNSGDEEKLRTFFTENIAPESLKQRPVEPRLAFHRQVRNDFQKIEISKVISISDTEIKIMATSIGGATIAYTFSIDPKTSKFIGFQIEPTEDPDDQPGPGAAFPAPTTRAELIGNTDKLFSALAGSDAFSGVVMIAKDDKPIFAKAFGYADADKKTKNEIDTRFNLGSINKVFTRIAIGQLIRQGKLSYDDKLIKVLPDYPNRDAAAKITIGNLITMTSGIGDFFNDKYFAIDKGSLRSLKDYLPLFANEPLEFEPGTSNRYSNGGYLVLGLVIEKLSGKSYYDYVRDNVFKPAGMTHTDSYEIDKLPANTAYGYMPGKIRNDKSLPGRGSSAGGGYSTAGDLLKFSNALRGKILAIPDDKGGFPTEFTGIGVAGGSEGVNALFIANGQTGYTIIVLSNYEPPSAERPGMQVRDWLKHVKE